MPRFFFHIRGIGQSLSRDELGVDFPDAKTACREAFLAASAIEDEFAARGQSPWDYSIEVVTASDELVLALPFARLRGHWFPASGSTEKSCRLQDPSKNSGGDIIALRQACVGRR